LSETKTERRARLNRERVARHRAKNRQAMNAKQKAKRHRAKLTHDLLDTWPYCHWRMFTGSPCRRKPTTRFRSSPMCQEHCDQAESL